MCKIPSSGDASRCRIEKTTNSLGTHESVQMLQLPCQNTREQNENNGKKINGRDGPDTTLASPLARDLPILLQIYSRVCQKSSATVTSTVSKNYGFHGNRGRGAGKALHPQICLRNRAVFRERERVVCVAGPRRDRS